MSPLALIVMMMRVGLSVWKKVSVREREKIFENTLQGIVQWLEIYGEGGGIFSKTHTKASGGETI